ncbi:Uncharacterised protein [Pseudomonas aeruginosa]|nr:Uncharacterised protein [Pseudomonas aeruginosa]
MSHDRPSAASGPWSGSTNPPQSQGNLPIYQGFSRTRNPRRPCARLATITVVPTTRKQPSCSAPSSPAPPPAAWSTGLTSSHLGKPGPRQGPGAAQRLHPCLADLRRGHHRRAAAGRTLPRLGVRRGSGALHPRAAPSSPARRGVTARRDRDHRRGPSSASTRARSSASRRPARCGGRRHHDGRQAFLHRRIGAHTNAGRRPADDRDPRETRPQRLGGHAWRKSCT